ncbi:MAG: hypothetical protein QM661_05835 [Solimonas sp.]
MPAPPVALAAIALAPLHHRGRFAEACAALDLGVLTPDQAIGMFRVMLDQTPVEHFMLMLPPAEFRQYADVFAKEAMPAFR